MRDYTRLVPQPKTLKTLRDLVREHLNHARITQAQLASIWNMHPASARRLLNPHNDRPNLITPTLIELLVVALKLDEFDAHELHCRAAIEAGFKIHLQKRALK